MRRLLLAAMFAASAALGAEMCPPAGKDVLTKVNARLEREFMSDEGLLLDYVGEIPTPQDIADLRPNAMGWWSPIENGSMFTGEWLPALMAEGPGRKPLVERCVRGLLKMSEISDVPGFIARGTGTDGKCHFPCGSNDQTDPWFLGLIEYCRWPYADAELKVRVVNRLVHVAKALEANNWGVPCDGAFKGENRGNLRAKSGRDISGVARAMGGGGHRAASGFTVDGTVDEVFAVALPKLRALFKEDGAKAPDAS